MNRLLFILTFLCSYITLFSQESNLELVCSSGDSYHNSLYQINWSIGEIAVETLKGSSETLTQGLHQGQLKINTLISDTDLKIDLKVYPNPTSNFINLNSNINKRLSIQISNLDGTCIFKDEITESQWQFDLSNYATGTYIIIINNNKKHLKTFKIIKY